MTKSSSLPTSAYRARGALAVLSVLAALAGGAAAPGWAWPAPSAAVPHGLPAESEAGDRAKRLIVAQSDGQLETQGMDTQGMSREGIDDTEFDRGGIDAGGMDTEGTTRQGIDESEFDRGDRDAEGLDSGGMDKSGLISGRTDGASSQSE